MDKKNYLTKTFLKKEDKFIKTFFSKKEHRCYIRLATFYDGASVICDGYANNGEVFNAVFDIINELNEEYFLHSTDAKSEHEVMEMLCQEFDKRHNTTFSNEFSSN